jgi:hypothetical protein
MADDPPVVQSTLSRADNPLLELFYYVFHFTKACALQFSLFIFFPATSLTRVVNYSSDADWFSTVIIDF